MTKEPQPTTHNAERGARGTCRERSKTGSSLKRTEKKVGCSLISEISWRFRVKCSAVWRKRVARYVGDLEETCSVIWRKLIRRLSAKMCRRFGEIVRRFWRKPFGDNFGDLEKLIRKNHGRRFGELYSAKSWSAILYWSSLWSIVVLGDRMWRLKRNGEKEWRQIMEIKTLFITKWRVHIWSVSRIETYKVLDVP